MKTPTLIQFHGLEPSEALADSARQKAEKLNQYAAEIQTCRIDIEQLAKHKQQGRPFGVRLNLTLPGRELSVNGAVNEDAHLALHDAFDRMTRQLRDTMSRLQERSPRPQPE